MTVNAIVIKDQKVWNIFKVPFQIGSALPSQNLSSPKETEEVPVNIEPKVGIALQVNDGPKNEPEETQVPKPAEQPTPTEILRATIQEPKPAETPTDILPTINQEQRPTDSPQIIIMDTPTETPTVMEEPKVVPPVNSEPYHTEKQEPTAVPQQSSPVQESPYAVSNPPKKTYPKRKNPKRKNPKRKKTHYPKHSSSGKHSNSGKHSGSGKHSSSGKKPCPKTYNKNKQYGMNPAMLKKYQPTQRKVVYSK